MKIDKEIIQAKIDIIEQNLNFLDQIAKSKYTEFEENYRDVLATKHALQESIVASLDMANYIISLLGYRRAEDYADTFQVLRENKIIDKTLCDKLVRMAKFRNLLVHRYALIENKKLHVITKESLKDIKSFVKSILEFISKNNI